MSSKLTYLPLQNIYYGTLYAYTPEVLPSAHRGTGNGILPASYSLQAMAKLTFFSPLRRYRYRIQPPHGTYGPNYHAQQSTSL